MGVPLAVPGYYWGNTSYPQFYGEAPAPPLE